MHGVRLGDHLLLFCSITGPDDTPKSLVCRGVGWTAFLVSNLAQDPLHWAIRRIQPPVNTRNVTVGVAALIEGDYVYVYGFDEPRHDAYLLRLPVSSATAGNLSAFEWCSGPDRACVPHKKLHRTPPPLFPPASPRLS